MLRKTMILAGLAAFALSGCATTQADPAPSSLMRKAPQWSIVPAADNSRASEHAEGSFAHTQGKLVLLGGRRLPETDIFDMASCTWSKGPAAPFQIHHFQAVGAEGLIYIIGAFTDNYPAETPVPHVMIYDVAAASWREGPEIPEDRRRGAAAAVLMGEWIMVIGGAQNGHIGGHTAWTDRFNIRTGAWERLPDAPRPRDHVAAAATADGKVVVAGGRLSQAPRNTFNLTIPEIDVYDPASRSWTTASAMLPTQRAGLTAVEYGGIAYFLGGESAAQSTAHREVEGYSPGAGRAGLSRLPDMPEGSHGFGAAAVTEDGEEAIYTTGGVITRGGGPAWLDLARFGVGEGACKAP